MCHGDGDGSGRRAGGVSRRGAGRLLALAVARRVGVAAGIRRPAESAARGGARAAARPPRRRGGVFLPSLVFPLGSRQPLRPPGGAAAAMSARSPLVRLVAPLAVRLLPAPPLR